MKVFSKLKEEFFKILPPTIYFFVALHLVMFIRVLLLEGTEVSPSSSISIAVAALILGKAVLLADMLPNSQSISAQTVNLQHRLENRDLSIAFHCHSLSGTPGRVLAEDRRYRCRQSEVAFRNRLAAFLGHPDRSYSCSLPSIARSMKLARVIGREKILRIFFGPMPTPQV